MSVDHNSKIIVGLHESKFEDKDLWKRAYEDEEFWCSDDIEGFSINDMHSETDCFVGFQLRKADEDNYSIIDESLMIDMEKMKQRFKEIFSLDAEVYMISCTG